MTSIITVSLPGLSDAPRPYSEPMVSTLALAALALAPDGGATLRVGVAGSAPFVLVDEAPRGLAVDLFTAAADNAGLDAQLAPVATVDEALDQLTRGELDVVVGPVSVTSARLERASFTQPYFQAGLSTLSRPGAQTLWSRVAPVLSRAFLTGAAVLVLLLFLVGSGIWLAERRENPQFPGDALRGIPAGMWLAVVTMTTVGYGDKAPVTARGRVFTALWMLTSMMFASSLTAGITTALTVSQISQRDFERPAELRRQRVATVSGSTSVDFIRRHGGVVYPRATLAEAIAALERDEVDAVVFDRPMLQHWVHTHADAPVLLSDAEWEPQGYAFAVPLDSEALHALDVALVELQESGRVAAITSTWLGGAPR